MAAAKPIDKNESLAKNCKLINEDSISSPFLADLESKFGLPGGDNCTIVLDHLPYGELAEELIYEYYPVYLFE